MKRITLIVLLTLLVSLLVFNLASAASPVGTCKRGWKLIALPGSVSASTDKNGDGFVCTSSRGATTYYIDNFNLNKAGCISTRFKFGKFK